MSQDIREKHPSYGLASFSRVSGNPGRLFGSPFENHNSFISLRIASGELIRTENGDRYFGPMRGDIVEVAFSAAQFAELLTTMGVGLGVPCTVQYIKGEKIPAPPERPHEAEHIRTEFKEQLQDFVRDIKDRGAKAKALIAKKTLTKADQEELNRLVGGMVTEVESNIPFVLETFTEATEKVVVQAKAEVDAFATTVIHQAGLNAIAEKGQALLGEGSE